MTRTLIRPISFTISYQHPPFIPLQNPPLIPIPPPLLPTPPIRSIRHRANQDTLPPSTPSHPSPKSSLLTLHHPPTPPPPSTSPHLTHHPPTPPHPPTFPQLPSLGHHFLTSRGNSGNYGNISVVYFQWPIPTVLPLFRNGSNGCLQLPLQW